MKPLGRRMVQGTPDDRTAASDAVHMLTIALVGLPPTIEREVEENNVIHAGAADLLQHPGHVLVTSQQEDAAHAFERCGERSGLVEIAAGDLHARRQRAGVAADQRAHPPIRAEQLRDELAPDVACRTSHENHAPSSSSSRREMVVPGPRPMARIW